MDKLEQKAIDGLLMLGSIPRAHKIYADRCKRLELAREATRVKRAKFLEIIEARRLRMKKMWQKKNCPKGKKICPKGKKNT